MRRARPAVPPSEDQRIIRRAPRAQRQIFGEPNAKLSKPGIMLRYGERGSKSIDLKKGLFFDHETATGGGVIDLVKLTQNFSEPGEALEWLRREGFINGAAPHPYQAYPSCSKS